MTAKPIFQSCVAFSEAMVSNVNMQSKFSGNPQAMGRIAAAYQRKLKWDTGATINICFLDGNVSKRKFVKDTINQNLFNKNKDPHTCNLNLNFNWMNENGGFPTYEEKNDSDVRISFEPNIGAFSYLGIENKSIPKNEKTMNLSWLDDGPGLNGGVCIHEFGHMLSLIHEQASPAASSTINWDIEAVNRLFGEPPNSWSPEQVQTNVLATVDESSHNSSEYDPKSIMHYIFDCECFIDCNPGPELECLCSTRSACACVPNNIYSTQILSDIDIRVLESMYPFGDAPNTEPETIDEIVDNIDDEPVGCKKCEFWNRGTIAFFVLMLLFLIAVVALLIWIFRRK